jgi:hypothetical protein
MVFSPPTNHLRESKEAEVVDASPDPQEALLLYGRMLSDAEVVRAELGGLLWHEHEYRSRLRVIVSASRRLAERAAKLLGEEL